MLAYVFCFTTTINFSLTNCSQLIIYIHDLIGRQSEPIFAFF